MAGPVTTAALIGGAFVGLASLIGRPRHGELAAARKSPIRLACDWEEWTGISEGEISPEELFDAEAADMPEFVKLHTRGAKNKRTEVRRFLRSCQWQCTGRVKAARFIHRKNPGEFAILHPSSKPAVAWQVSLFDKDGPVGDRPRDSCSEAAKELSPREWRLAEVE